MKNGDFYSTFADYCTEVYISAKRTSGVCWLWSDKILDSCFLQLYKRLCQMLCHVVFMVYYCDLITQVFCGCGYYFGSGLSG